MKGGDKYEKHEQNRRNKQTRKHNILILTISNNPEKYKPKEIPFLMNIINDDENKCFEC